MGLPAAALAVTAVAAAAGAYATYEQSQAQKSAARYQGKMAEFNRGQAELQARDLEARGADEEAAYRLKLQQLLSTQRTQIAGTGGDVGSGSALDILGDTAAEGMKDILNMRRNTERQAYATRLEGYGFGAQANLLRSEAANTRPMLNAGISLIGGSATLADRWYAYSRAK